MNLYTETLSGDEIPNGSIFNQHICSSSCVKRNGPDSVCGVQPSLNDAITTGNFLCLLSPEMCNPTPFTYKMGYIKHDRKSSLYALYKVIKISLPQSKWDIPLVIGP